VRGIESVPTRVRIAGMSVVSVVDGTNQIQKQPAAARGLFCGRLLSRVTTDRISTQAPQYQNQVFRETNDYSSALLRIVGQ
jgi:hypothetical protein